MSRSGWTLFYEPERSDVRDAFYRAWYPTARSPRGDVTFNPRVLLLNEA